MSPRGRGPGGSGIEVITPSGLYPDTPYVYATVAPPGRLVFTAGACPLGPDGVVVGVGDLEAQAGQTVANLVAVLGAAGTSVGAVLKTTVYVVATARHDLVRVWRVVEAAFEPHRPPSTLLGVAMLGYESQLVEIEAVALVPPEGEPAPSP